jgi:hypothetical protein
MKKLMYRHNNRLVTNDIHQPGRRTAAFAITVPLQHDALTSTCGGCHNFSNFFAIGKVWLGHPLTGTVNFLNFFYPYFQNINWRRVNGTG